MPTLDNGTPVLENTSYGRFSDSTAVRGVQATQQITHEQLVRLNRHMLSDDRIFSDEYQSDFEPEQASVSSKTLKEKIVEVRQKRHLTHDERANYHKPKSDGKLCMSSVDVDDIMPCVSLVKTT